MKIAQLLTATGLIVWTMLAATPAAAQSKEVIDAGVVETVKQFNLLDPRHATLGSQAAGMLVFPKVTKGGIGVASEYGEGALCIGGVTVDYYRVASASIGLTAGMATHSEVILFMTDEALKGFKQGKGWSIGADTGIVVLSKGRTDDYDMNKLQKKPVLVFLFAEQGLIADLSLHGTKVDKISK